MVLFGLYDILGRACEMEYTLKPSGNGKIRIELWRKELPAGLYFYEIKHYEKVIAKGKVLAQ